MIGHPIARESESVQRNTADLIERTNEWKDSDSDNDIGLQLILTYVQSLLLGCMPRVAFVLIQWPLLAWLASCRGGGGRRGTADRERLSLLLQQHGDRIG